ncbi:MAG: hypothetical protein GY928_01940 [Colwellia sp.]|nr:hypothetical protein [Colwellia sp.]
MAEPLNLRSIEHWLNFISGGEGMIRVDELIGFDSADFVFKQEEGRYGRDISFSGGETDFEFPNSAGSQYGFQFDLLTTYDTIYGYEAQVEYILREGTTDYVIGELDFFTKETDQITYFRTKVIQSTTEAILKRRSKIAVDLFGTEDLDGNTIDAISTSNILLEAKPVLQVSKWTASLPYWTSTFTIILGNQEQQRFHQNPINSITQGEIENTLAGFERSVEGITIDTQFYNDVYNIPWIEAQEDLSPVTIDITNTVISIFTSTQSTYTDPISLRSWIFEVDSPDSPISSQFDDLSYTSDYIGNESVDRFGDFEGNAHRHDITLDATQITLDEGIQRGHRYCAMFYFTTSFVIMEWLSGDVTATVTSTAINSVTPGIRLIDAMNQTLLNIDGDFVLSAPRFELGGEWYDNFVFTGNMIRGRDTKYPLKWDDINNFTKEFNSDFEIASNNIFYGKYDDFYTNVESGTFLQIPDDTFNITYNELYAINEFNFNYKNFNQDKDDDNTIDGMHTEVQFALINKQVENTKEIELDHIRDAYMLETTRKKAVESNESGTSSLSQDNKTFMVDVVEITTETGGFSDSLNHIVNDDSTGYLLLQNSGNFNWLLLGFSVGDEFVVVNTGNAGTYTVIEIEAQIVTLEIGFIFSLPTNLGSLITEVEYPYSNVDFKARTDEGFDSITGIQGSDTYVNLLYTPKRNILNNWNPFLATCVSYNSSDIKVQSFVNEPTLVTQFDGGDVITENSNITQSELETALLTPRLIHTKVLCDFSTFQAYKDSVQADRGFTRIYDNENRVLKGYAKEASFQWANNILELDLEQKYESEITDITFDSLALSYVIDEVGYDQDVLPIIEFETKGDYVQLFDSLMRPLTNRARFDRYSVNNVIFNSTIELTTAINDLN